MIYHLTSPCPTTYIFLLQVFNPPVVPKLSTSTSPSATSTKPLNFGILGAATIGPPALIFPARCHPDVVIYAVAARKLEKAKAYAKRWGIEKAYEGYQNLLDDPEVDVVYNAVCPSRYTVMCLFEAF